MDCLTAQGLISDAVDRAPLDATELAQAKTHCQTCPTCSVFVRTLLLVKSTPLPQPPEDLADRVMASIRSEAILAQQRAAAAAAARQASAETAERADANAEADTPTDAASAPGADASEMPGAVIASLRRWVGSLSRPEMIGWAGAAALFVAAVGITASAGTRMLTATPGLTTESASTFNTADKSAAQLSAPSAESADSIAGATVAATPGSYITVNGAVFVLSGPSTIATEGLKPVGSTTSALGSGSGPTPHAVYSGDDPDRVYLTDETKKQQLAFDRVVRQYAGRTYQLTGAEVFDFGQWPTLPAQIPAPAGPDGSPTFVALTPAGSGTQVYRLASGSPDAGIGIGPASDSSDPAGGNPNWTWWTPAQ